MGTITLIDTDLEAALFYIESLGFSTEDFRARYGESYSVITAEPVAGAPIFGQTPRTFSAGGYRFFIFPTELTLLVRVADRYL